MPDFAQRTYAEELMDTEIVSPADFAACLRDLNTVNTLTIARPPTLDWVARAVAAHPGRMLTLVDVGSGEGDMLRAIRRRLDRAGLDARLIGVDLNPNSEPAARAATRAADRIEYVTANVFDYDPGVPVDLIASSLFVHHLGDDAAVAFVAWMERTARVGWFVNDLHRHPVANHGFRALAWAMRWHRFVRHDGPLSVARSYTRADWNRVLAAAGVSGATVRWRFPFRWAVSRLK